MVKIFKTNVRNCRQATEIIKKLLHEFPSHKINFDLFDYDGVLRVQGNYIRQRKGIRIVTSLNYNCEILR